MSKFSVLKVEGLSSSDDEGDKRPSSGAGKKRPVLVPRKKKSSPAGGGGAAASQQQQQRKPNPPRLQQPRPAPDPDEWSRKDAQVTEAIYERELAEAMMASKLDTTAAAVPSSRQTYDSAQSLASIEAASQRAASDLLKREKRTDRDRLRHEIELGLQAEFQAVVAEKDSANAALSAELDALKQQAAAADKEIERLTSLLSLVEGKKAKGLAEQIFQLTCVIQELTDHGKLLDSELAKERTRSHQLQEQLDRLRPAR